MSKVNVDHAEVAKFEELAGRWWDTDGEFRPLHDMNPLRLHYINERCHLEGKKVLDVGCGGGILAESMARLGAHVKGIDMGKAPLSVAKLHAMEAEVDVSYQQIPVEELAEQETGSYDVVCCMEMLEHVPDPSSIIQACATLLKPGGALFMSTINRHPKAFALAIVGAEYVLQMLPKGTHEYKKFIRPSELDRWSRQADMNLRHITGIQYNPLFKSFKLVPQDTDVNYMVYYTKPSEA